MSLAIFSSKSTRRGFAIVSAIIIISVSLYAVYYVYHLKPQPKKLPGPYIALLGYGTNGTSVSPIKENLSADLSVWDPSSSGNGTTENLYNSSVSWNQVIAAGWNFTNVANSWKEFMHSYTSEPTMSLIVTYTKVNGSKLDIYEYYTNIAFNPFASNLTFQVFTDNFTMDLSHPFSVINMENNSTAASVYLPDSPIVPGSCQPGNSYIDWTRTLTENGYYPLNIVNATAEPANEQTSLSWSDGKFSAKFEFTGATTTNSDVLTSKNGYESPNLIFSAGSYSYSGDSGYLDAMWLKNTTMTWTFGTEYFYEPYDNGQYCELVGAAEVSNLKVQYCAAATIESAGVPFSSQQAPNRSTWGNPYFDAEWMRAIASAFSNHYTSIDKTFTISAGATIQLSDFEIQSSTNFNSIMNTFQDEGLVALGIAEAGLTIAVMGAAASGFPGGATASTIAEIGEIAGIIGVADSVINLVSSFTLIVSASGSFQTLSVTNQIVDLFGHTSPITVSLYGAGGSTDFNSGSGTVSYIARTPYEYVS